MIVLPAPAASIPAGRVPVIVRYDTDLCLWRLLATIHVPDQEVALTSLERIDRLAVVTLPEPAACDAYTACGGNVVGTWGTTTFCDPDTVPPEEFLFCKGVPGSSTISMVTLHAAAVTFDDDSRFAWDFSSGLHYTTTMRPACTSIIEQYLAGSTSSCAHMGDELALAGWNVGICRGDVAVECTCEGGGPTPSEDPWVGAYTTDANNIILTRDGQPAGSPEPYCLDGSELRMGTGIDMIVLAP
jgi:hypothetical protein